MAQCKLCDDKAPDISKALGVCLACIREKPQQALEIAEGAHRQSRIEFGLPPLPPDDPDGVRCNLCVNSCKIGKNRIGYCGLRQNQDGRLAGVSASRANLSWYHDPLPTNCVADWVCAGGTGAGYPDYAHRQGAESTTNRKAGGLDFRPEAGKTKARQCFIGCGCNRVHSTRFENNQSGYKNLAVFFQACSFNCLFCQNWHFKSDSISSPTRSVRDLLKNVDSTTSCICYFGGDPSPQLPFAINASRAARDKHKNDILRICWETNGSMNPKLLDRMMELAVSSGGCVKFDLKAWDDNLHTALTGVQNQRTLDNFARAAAHVDRRPCPPPLVASSLLVPGYIDAAEVAAIARFIADLDPDIPYSLLAFHPQFYMSDLPLTPKHLANQCLTAAREAGLKNVRIGNYHLLV